MPFRYTEPRRLDFFVTYTIDDVLDMDPSGANTVRELLAYAAFETIDKELVAGYRLSHILFEPEGGWPQWGRYGDDDPDPYSIQVSIHYVEKE